MLRTSHPAIHRNISSLFRRDQGVLLAFRTDYSLAVDLSLSHRDRKLHKASFVYFYLRRDLNLLCYLCSIPFGRYSNLPYLKHLRYPIENVSRGTPLRNSTSK